MKALTGSEAEVEQSCCLGFFKKEKNIVIPSWQSSSSYDENYFKCHKKGGIGYKYTDVLRCLRLGAV